MDGRHSTGQRLGDFAKVCQLLDYRASPNTGLSVISGIMHHFDIERDSLSITDYSRLAIAKILVETG
jgi:hypothetical protein